MKPSGPPAAILPRTARGIRAAGRRQNGFRALRHAAVVLPILSMLPFAQAATRAGEEDRAGGPILTVLFTAEIHGRLLPCDCPIQPLGGIARRATRIERYRRRGPTLVIDAGGWQAGGARDPDSDGRPQRDALRTELLARAMTRMAYDVVCGTPDDPLKEPYARLADGAVRLRLPEQALEVPLQLYAGDAKTCLWARTSAAPADAGTTRAPPIAISRLDESETARLAATFAEETLVIAPVASASPRMLWTSGKATVVGFDGRSESLGVAEIHPSTREGRRFEIRVRIDPLTENVPENPDLLALLEPHYPTLKPRGRRQIEMEYWTRPGPFAREPALNDVLRAARESGDRVLVSLRFYLPEEILSTRSIQSRTEWAEAGLYAVVQRHYPERFQAWCAWRAAHPDRPWEDGARALGLLAARIRGALAVGEDASLLRADHREMVRRGLDSADALDDCELLQRRRGRSPPTLVIGHRLHRRTIDYPNVMRALCASLEAPRPASCAPWVGSTEPSAEAPSHPEVTARVIVDPASLFDNRRSIMEALADDLPGIRFQVLDGNLPEARELLDRTGIAWLPAYVLDANAEDEASFRNGAGALARRHAAGLILDGRERVGANRLSDRPRIEGRIDLFVARSSEAGRRALRLALENAQRQAEWSPELIVHDVVWRDGSSSRYGLTAPGGADGIDEALRAATVRQAAPEKLPLYLKERLRAEAETALRLAGLDPAWTDALATRPVDGVLKGLYDDADLLARLGSPPADVVLLAENCELIPLHSPADIARTFERIGPRKR